MELNKQDAVLLAAWVATVMIRIGLVIAWIGAFFGFIIKLFWLTVSRVGVPDVPPSMGDDAGGAVVLFVSLVALGLITAFFNRLAQIISTVGTGDPFIPENASRLHRMAWQALSAQALAIVLAVLARWIGQDVAPRVIQALFGFWLGGLILSLTLFVLARVFRKGTEMRKTHTEIALAKEIHQLLVPPIERHLGAVEFYGASVPSGDVGGDLVDLVEVDGAWVAVLADVSGHGVASGTLMGMFKSAVRSRLRVESGLDRLLTDIHAVIFDLKKSNMFVTCALLRGTSGDRLEFATAGHHPILHYRHAAQAVDALSVAQPPIGIFRDQTFTTAWQGAEPGDVFALMSDGIPEVFDERDEELGTGPIEELLANHADRPLPEIFQTILTAARAHGRQLDDQSLLLVRYRG